MLVTDTVYSNDTLEVNSSIQQLLSPFQLFLMFYFEQALPEKNNSKEKHKFLAF